jgi:hypothetical protein
MKNTFTIATLLFALFLTSCSNASNEKAADSKETELLKKELELSKKELELNKKERTQASETQSSKTSGAAKEVPRDIERNMQRNLPVAETQSASSSMDFHADPVKVVQKIFDAAKYSNYAVLSGLCDPTGSGDGDTKAICNVSALPKQAQEEFKKYFQNGQTVGRAEINGNSAKVKIKFGPDGERDEEMNLRNIDGKWYLSSF